MKWQSRRNSVGWFSIRSPERRHAGRSIKVHVVPIPFAILCAFASWRQGFCVSTAAQRGNDDHFVIGVQAMMQAADAVAVHEEADMRVDAILFVNDPVAHYRIAGLEKLQQLREPLDGDNRFIRKC